METSNEAEIQARLNVVVVRAHRPLTDDELTLVRTRIERDLTHREEMRTLPLANGDAPGADFNPRFALDGGLGW